MSAQTDYKTWKKTKDKSATVGESLDGVREGMDGGTGAMVEAWPRLVTHLVLVVNIDVGFRHTLIPYFHSVWLLSTSLLPQLCFLIFLYSSTIQRHI